MQAVDDHASKVLSSLIARTRDSADSYRKAAELVENPRYKSMLAERGGKRLALSRRLQSEVGPVEGQSGSGRSFIGLREAAAGSRDKGVIDEVERGEDVLKAQFESIIDSANLPPQIRTLVLRLYQEVKADHDQVSRLKHALQ